MCSVVVLLALTAPSAQAQLVPFRDAATGLWGFRRADGTVTITPRYTGAGHFRAGQALVEDHLGFAIIDAAARVVDRVATDSVTGTAIPVPPPDDDCLWRNSDMFPSQGMDCYVEQLAQGTAIMDTIVRRPRGGMYSGVYFRRLRYGSVVIEEARSEGRTTRLLLPGMTPLAADFWVQKFYKDDEALKTGGCSEHWSSGAVRGGAFIQRSYGC